MTDYSKLPNADGLFYVHTASGAVHVMDNSHVGRATWERRPGPRSARMRYDDYSRPISELRSWIVGECGFVVAADSSYGYGPTTHTTSTIVRITDQHAATGIQ